MEVDNLKRRKPTIDLSIYGKVPPQAVDLEKEVLGSILLGFNKDAFDTAIEILKPESFYTDAHQRIFKSFQRIQSRFVRCELLTVVEDLKKSEELDLIGGPFALTILTNKVVSDVNLEDHCRIIHQKFIQRELIRISGETITAAYEDSTDCFELLDKHETSLIDLSKGVSSNMQTSGELSVKAMRRIDFLLNNPHILSGVPTGFKMLDRLTNGWQPTDLIILAARPSVGKTCFALNLALNAATSQIKKTSVAFFSLEMSADQLTQRILSTISSVYLDRIVNGKLYDGDYENVTTAGEAFSKMKIFIDDTAGLNIFELRAKARRLVNKNKVGLIIIDYLQLMSGIDKKNGNREQEIARISRDLKGLAKQLKVPIIALSQMSRDIEKRKEKTEPMLSDLRESGAIEQDADMVMFLYRPDYQQSASEGDFSLKGQAFCKIAKHRNGSLETVPFRNNLAIQKWFDADYQTGDVTISQPLSQFEGF